MSSTPRKTSILITGCSAGGIGHAAAIEYHKRGCFVIATARREETMKELRELGVTVLPLDVIDKESIATCKSKVEELTGGKLDILINNAGRPHVIPATDFDLDDARLTYDTNVFGPMLTIQAFIRLLVAARGLIVNVSSASTEVPYLFGSVYSASKHALNQYSRILRLELKPLNVRVMVSMTGTVKSNIASREHRALPSNSLFKPVEDMYQSRITFSQKSGTMSAEQFAKGLVTETLKGEGWLSGWIGGTRDWYWGGGIAGIVWFLTLLPRGVAEGLTGLYFGLPKMRARFNAAALKKD